VPVSAGKWCRLRTGQNTIVQNDGELGLGEPTYPLSAAQKKKKVQNSCKGRFGKSQNVLGV